MNSESPDYEYMGARTRSASQQHFNLMEDYSDTPRVPEFDEAVHQRVREEVEEVKAAMARDLREMEEKMESMFQRGLREKEADLQSRHREEMARLRSQWDREMQAIREERMRQEVRDSQRSRSNSQTAPRPTTPYSNTPPLVPPVQTNIGHQHHVTFRVRDIEIDGFDPTRTGVEAWLKRFDRAVWMSEQLRGYAWTEELKYGVVVAKLEGIAAMWFDNVEDQIHENDKTYRSFRARLLNQYGTMKAASEVQWRMMRMNKEPKSTWMDFAAKLRAVGDGNDISEAQYVTAFLNGLTYNRSCMLKGQSFTSLEQAAAKAEFIFGFDGREKDRGRVNRANGEEGEKSRAKNVAKYPRNKAKVDLSKIECYRCHKMGHYSRECPERKKTEKVNDDNQESSGKEEEA